MNEGQLFYFPLCSLSYSKDCHKTFEYIISYCIIEYGYRLISNFELSEGDYNKIEKEVKKNPISNFNKKCNEHYYFVFSAIKQGVNFYNVENLINQYKEINLFIENYERKHGKDARVKIHKDLLFEVRDGKFDLKQFQVLCAIKSVIGKKDFARVTVNRIRFRMFGYKDKDIYYKEKCEEKLLTDRQIKTIVMKLLDRDFYDRFTYRKRITFYSTKYKGKDFENIIINSIGLNKAKKQEHQIRAKRLESEIDKKAMEIRQQMVTGKSYKEIKSNLELVKTG